MRLSLSRQFIILVPQSPTLKLAFKHIRTSTTDECNHRLSACYASLLRITNTNAIVQRSHHTLLTFMRAVRLCNRLPLASATAPPVTAE